MVSENGATATARYDATAAIYGHAYAATGIASRAGGGSIGMRLLCGPLVILFFIFCL